MEMELAGKFTPLEVMFLHENLHSAHGFSTAKLVKPKAVRIKDLGIRPNVMYFRLRDRDCLIIHRDQLIQHGVMLVKGETTTVYEESKKDDQQPTRGKKKPSDAPH